MTSQQGQPVPTGRVEGHVYWWDTGRSKIGTRGARYAVVKAIPTRSGHAQIARADEDGRFVFEQLPHDKWLFIPLHELGRAFGQKEADRTVDVPGKNEPQDLSILRLGVIDNSMGEEHFKRLLLVLLLAFLIYLVLHIVWPAQVKPISASLSALTTQVADQVRAAPTLSTDAALGANLAEMRRVTTALAANAQSGLSEGDAQELGGLLTQIESAVAKDTRTAARLGVLRLQYMLRFLGTPGYYWIDEPWRYVEVLFWALAGVVISQLVDTSNYLRRGTYLRDAQMQRYTLLVAAPLVTLVFVLLLSLATLEVTLENGGKLRLDLGDPRILAAVAFVIGLSFWRSWDSLRGFSQRLLAPPPQPANDAD